ncbi:hypothetical protein ACJMK2_022276 [Sinanodonta woodiana]|uniref:Novel STAND NTPase 3 domain-containing protein n=1 Tax=Sinanodonta woodiana TaxID=1069815 RepID=A0ABD3TJI0_SINWO
MDEANISTDVEDLGTDSQECRSGIMTLQGNNTNRNGKAVGKGISESGIPEKLHRSVLNHCLPQLVRDLDFRTISIYIQQKEIFDDVTMRDILHAGLPSNQITGLIERIQQRDQSTYETFKKCLVLAKQEDLKDMLEEEEERVAMNKGIETAPNRRPESEKLKRLKSQTENKLGTVKKLGYIPTSQAAEAEKLLVEKRSVVIRGNPGEGKTTIALHLIDNEKYRDRRVVVYSPRDWKTVDTDWVDIVVLEDILGKYDLDPSRLQEWMVYLPTIQEHVDAGNLQVIIIIRTDILEKAFSKLRPLKLFSDHLSLTLSSKNLNKVEKMSILNRELQRHQKTMNEDEKEKCIANFIGMIGFPQSCSLFAADSMLFIRGPEFFKSPIEFFFENIFNLKAEMFISLAFLFCHGEIYEEDLSSKITSNDLFMDLVNHLNISQEKADITILRDAYENFEGMYIEKSISDEIVKGVAVKRSCIRFTHATVCEAVGQVLAKHSLEMVVKHGNPEYLYQRTYTAEEKDKTSENVFLPVCMYSSMAERIVQDVVDKTLVKSVVKHSVLKQNTFLMKLKEVLHEGNSPVKDFFMANIFRDFIFLKSRFFDQHLSEGECLTFLQYVLQNDDVTVKLVYNHFMEFLVCTHNKNNSDCWQCKEKQNVLELALYYHYFEIADKLITMNACYTHVSLCNAARHGDLSRVQTILEDLKRSQVLDPDCTEAKQALFRAYLSGSQVVIEILLQEGITLDSLHLVHAVQHGDISVLMKVVEQLKLHDKWYQLCACDRKSWLLFDLVILGNISFVPDRLEGSTALCLALCNEKFEMANYLLQNETKLSMGMLAVVTKHSSMKAVDRLIQLLKVKCIWDPHCSDASHALGIAYGTQKYDVCDMLVNKERVRMTVKDLDCVVGRFKISSHAVEKAVQHLKDTKNWDPNCEDASNVLFLAYWSSNYDVCDLLIREGVSITMKHVHSVILRSLDYVKTVVQQLKDTESWDPNCDDASEALVNAYREEKYDVCDLLIKEKVSLTMKNLSHVVAGFKVSVVAVEKAVEHLKNIKNWDPSCEDALKALDLAYMCRNYDVCDLLIKEGVSMTVKHVPHVVLRSLDYVKTVVKQLKDTDSWDPKCDDASEALANAYREEKYDVCDLLIQEGVSLTMKHLLLGIIRLDTSLVYVKKVVQHLKDTKNWDPKCKIASKTLKETFRRKMFDVYNILIEEGVSLTMKNFLLVVGGFDISIESVKKAVGHLKDTNNWDPNCNDALEALAEAYREMKYDVCDLLVQVGVSLTMKCIPHVIMRSLNSVKTVVNQLKDTGSWDPMHDDATKALEEAYIQQKYDVCDLMIQEGVSLTMKNLLHVVAGFEVSVDTVIKAIQQLKDRHNWDPKCNDASILLENAYGEKRYEVCDLLIQEGVSLTMKNIPGVVYLLSLKHVKKAIQHLDRCLVLIQNRLTLIVGNDIPIGTFQMPLETVMKAIEHLKEKKKWDAKSDEASEALANAYSAQMYDVCDMLLEEKVSLTMKHFPGVVAGFKVSCSAVIKAMQQLKATDMWDPKCEYASRALANAYRKQKYDVCGLLIQEGISLTMQTFNGVVEGYPVSLEAVKKALQHLKDTDNWVPSCEHASEALENAYVVQEYDVCDLLIQEGVSLLMKNIPGVVYSVSAKYVIKVIQHMNKYDVFDLLFLKRVSPTLNNLPYVIGRSKVSLKAVSKVIHHLKETKKWDPKSVYASIALANASSASIHDVCDLLAQEGVLPENEESSANGAGNSGIIVI